VKGKRLKVKGMAFGRLRLEVGGEKKWELGMGNAESKNRRKGKG
jgi:hypothetical protein